MEYKVGQKVRINSEEWFEENTNYRKGDWVFSFCGEEATITGTFDLGYTLNIGPEGMCWYDECFEPIRQVSEVYQVTKEDLIGDIKYFPIEVVQRMVDCQVEQGNRANVLIFQECSTDDKGEGGFNWSETEEGLGFWDAVICEKNFNVFFQKYPKQNKVTIKKDMETNKLILNGITLPKDTEVKVSVDEGTTIITFQKQESDGNKFKKGDIIYIEGIYDYHDLAIVESIEGNYILVSGYIDLNANKTYICLNNDYDFYSKMNIKSVRLATKEEIYKLNKLFAEQKHLKWNAEELKFEKYRWRAECGDRYWHITELGTVIYSSDYHSPYDNILYNLRNYFQTEELAKQALPKLEDFFKNLNK